ncbi:LA2681 family HEPN domain-containing protein [Planococcus dechangensis]|uniref:LA2681 family HEPN domain-containing protein n=1 Tax=Planococcus dechangensis TaxID=1176255 RepID=A0ABV9MCH7_9BACL
MATLSDIALSDDLGQFEIKEIYSATHQLLQELQQAKAEAYPGRINSMINHLKERLKGKAAYPLVVLLETSHLSIRHQQQKDWNSDLKQLQLELYDNTLETYRGRIPASVWNQVCLNYAETLVHTGRSIDAQAVLKEMVKEDKDPSFQRLNGEFGWTLIFYSTFLPVKAERLRALEKALELFHVAQTDIQDDKGKKLYEERIKLAENMVGQLGDVEPVKLVDQPAPTEDEQRYLDWSAEQRLFLNSGNDIEPDTMAKRDLPLRIQNNAFLGNYLDSLTHEFTSMRRSLYTALTADEVADDHKMDGDNTVYSQRNENLKQVYRQAYSLFDKMALLMNHALQLGVEEPRANFQRIWFEEESLKKPLKPFIQTTKNDALKALYWLSKEVYGYELSEEQSMLVKKALHIRNRIDNSYLQVVKKAEPFEKESARAQSHHITEAELERLTLMMTQKARNGLMYLQFALAIGKK